MSRSYRKPYITDGYKGSNTKQFNKRWANKVIRRFPVDGGLANGKSYRKFYDSWNICDYRWYEKDIDKHWKEWWKLLRK